MWNPAHSGRWRTRKQDFNMTFRYRLLVWLFKGSLQTHLVCVGRRGEGCARWKNVRRVRGLQYSTFTKNVLFAHAALVLNC